MNKKSLNIRNYAAKKRKKDRNMKKTFKKFFFGREIILRFFSKLDYPLKP